MTMALPRPLEAALQRLERRGRETAGKIEEAAEAVVDVDLDDPSIVKHAEELGQAARAAARPRGVSRPLLVVTLRPPGQRS